MLSTLGERVIRTKASMWTVEEAVGSLCVPLREDVHICPHSVLVVHQGGREGDVVTRC